MQKNGWRKLVHNDAMKAVGVKIVGGRATMPETGSLDADGLIPLDWSGLYI